MRVAIYKSLALATPALVFSAVGALVQGADLLRGLGVGYLVAAAVFCPYVLVQAVTHTLSCAACRKRFGLEWYSNRKMRNLAYDIGGVVYHPAPVTRFLLDDLDETVWSPDNMFEAIFGPQSQESRAALVDSVYSQLSLLLVEQNGKHPTTEALELYVPVPEAMELIKKISPANRAPRLKQVDLD